MRARTPAAGGRGKGIKMQHMKTCRKKITLALLAASAFGCAFSAPREVPLKDALRGRFLVGAALNEAQVSGPDRRAAELAMREFNTVVAENCMKAASIHPEENRYNFGPADAFVEFGRKGRMKIIGHTLIWHSQLPEWFCVDSEGRNVSAQTLKKRMRDHIRTVMGRYRGAVKGWDVVNEAIEWDGSWRKSKFYEILGEEFLYLAFRYAREADPSAELYYNDYGMDGKAKRERVVEIIKNLKSRGLRIDAVGMQSHMGMGHPDIGEFEKSIEAFAAAGVKVMITEWDMSVLPFVASGAEISTNAAYREELNPYAESLPAEMSGKWNARMADFFRLFLKHSDKITRVTAWGVSDGDSWLNNWPVRGRTDYPLLFDRNLERKPFLNEVLGAKR